MTFTQIKIAFVAVLLLIIVPTVWIFLTPVTSSTTSGTVKTINEHNRIFCPDYFTADISLGVVRNGTGASSREDVTLVIENSVDVEKLTKASEVGSIVHIKHETPRFSWCNDSEVRFIKSVRVE